MPGLLNTAQGYGSNLYNRLPAPMQGYVNQYGPQMKQSALNALPGAAGAMAGYFGGPQMAPVGAGVGAGIANYLGGGASQSPYMSALKSSMQAYENPPSFDMNQWYNNMYSQFVPPMQQAGNQTLEEILNNYLATRG